MNIYRKGDRVNLAGQIVTIAAVHLQIRGETKYLVEFPDKTFSRVGASALSAIEDETDPKLQSDGCYGRVL